MIEGTVDIFEKFFKSREECIHTCLPGKITRYDADKRKAVVKPLVKIKNKNGAIIEVPAISEVPVICPGGSNFSLTWDIKNGDGCLILFAETGIGNYLNSSGQVVEADDMSRFSLTDAICIPGLFPFSSVPDSNVIIESTLNSKLKIENKTENLNTLLQDLITAIKDITTTGGYSVNPASQLSLTNIATRIETLLE
ncbi:MAG: Gp138 family membrane-puncturing spike protein [Nitrosopumilaceae archaeon]|jgi:hypothetical protein